MPYVESRRACNSHACYRAHSHPTFSIGAVDAGHSLFTNATQTAQAIGPGTVVLVPAALVHACNPLPGKAWSYQMLHVDAAWLAALWQETAHASAQEISPWPLAGAVLSQDAALYTRFCRLNACLFSHAHAQEKETALIDFLGACQPMPAGTAQAILQPGPARRRIQPALHLLHEELALAPSLQTLAHAAQMSRYQLIRAFRAATGLTPHAYQLNLRINHAREWLRVGDDLADVAYRLGFADQSHFQRVFKAHTGVTPGLYRA